MRILLIVLFLVHSPIARIMVVGISTIDRRLVVVATAIVHWLVNWVHMNWLLIFLVHTLRFIYSYPSLILSHSSIIFILLALFNGLCFFFDLFLTSLDLTLFCILSFAILGNFAWAAKDHRTAASCSIHARATAISNRLTCFASSRHEDTTTDNDDKYGEHNSKNCDVPTQALISIVNSQSISWIGVPITIIVVHIIIIIVVGGAIVVVIV
mmetsp:Transcript_31760/g.31038  ORF Transcript_31760/g.31038 Transcript_31760/m.31038 type:complete len:211 (-) Transcript_31760:462-1094(-)